MRRIILLFAAAVTAQAQALSVGALAGAPWTDVVNNASVSGLHAVARSTNFTGGGSIQVSLPAQFRIEVDALFRPYSFALSSLGSSSALSATQFRFPVLLQYRLGRHLLTPYAEGGLSFSHLTGISSAFTSAVKSGPGQLLHQSGAGVVLGAGVEAKIPALFRISGEVRLTRDTAAAFANVSNLNQAEVLLGIHF